jgi:hypothetical protein
MGSRLLRKKDKDKDKDMDKGKDKDKAKEKEKEKEKKENYEQRERVIERVREREKERKQQDKAREEEEEARAKGKGKGKGKERESNVDADEEEKVDDKSTINGSMSSKDSKKAKFASVFSDPAATSIASASPDPNLGNHWLTQSIKGTVPDPFHPPIRHARSQSNLQRGCAETASPSIRTREAAARDEGGAAAAATSTSAATEGSRGKKRLKIVKGVSAHAERFARGLDSALDFVDGRVGFGGTV